MILQMNIVAEQWEIKEKKSKILVNPSHLQKVIENPNLKSKPKSSLIYLEVEYTLKEDI